MQVDTLCRKLKTPKCVLLTLRLSAKTMAVFLLLIVDKNRRTCIYLSFGVSQYICVIKHEND